MIRISKTLTGNELGLTGSHQYGILVPKNSDLIGFFPRLDEFIANPSKEFEVEFLISGISERRIVRFVHYNSKLFRAGTRDEYRLTRLMPIIRSLKARVGDEVVFEKDNDDKITVRLERASVPDDNFRGGWKLVD
jgi:hypothetical protein